MSWYNKDNPTPFDNAPIEGLHFLIGEQIAPQSSELRNQKYPAVEFPSGVTRPLWESENPDHFGIIHLFGEMDLPFKDNRDSAYERAKDIAEQCGYSVKKRDDHSLELVGHTPDEYLLVTYDEQLGYISDIAQLDPLEWEKPVHPAHQLMTDEIREKLPKLYANENIGLEAVAPVKYFTPDSNWTWYASEFDGEDVFFGLVSGFEVELGYFTLSELQAIRGPLGLPIERDLHYKPQKLQDLFDMHWQERIEREKPRPKREPLTIERITRLSSELLLASGQHLPMVIIEGSLKTDMVVIEDMPPTHDERLQRMAHVGFTLAKQESVGELQQMVFVTEGWLSAGTPDSPPQIPPSQDPNRIEVLLINHLDVPNQKYQLMALEMIRDENGEVREVRPHESMKETEDMNVESPLLDALLIGYQSAKQTPKD